MTFVLLYVVFGILFLVGVVGYWLVTRLFDDYAATYVIEA